MHQGPAAAHDEEPSLGRVLDFMRVLWAVDHALTRVSKEMLANYGVTGLQRLVVRIVGKSPGISAGELARVLHVHPSTLTGVLRRLTDRGALTRTQDPADTRRALFRLTARGRQIDALRTGTIEERVRAALVALPDDDISATVKVLERIAATMSSTRRSRGAASR